jgi:hypothetical protein
MEMRRQLFELYWRTEGETQTYLYSQNRCLRVYSLSPCRPNALPANRMFEKRDYLSRTLFEDFSVKGEWWRVGSARKRVTGTLTIDPKRDIRLDLNGMFSHPKRSIHLPDHAKAIHGTTTEGTPVTLLKCHALSVGGAGAIYSINRAFVGAHFRDLSSLRIKWFAFSYLGLAEWIGHRPFTHESADSYTDSFTLCYQTPPTLTYNVPSQRLKVEFKSDWSMRSRSGPSRQELYHRDLVVVTPDRPIKWETYQAQQKDVLDLLTVLVGGRLPIQQLRLGITPHLTVPSNQRRNQSADVLYVFPRMRYLLDVSEFNAQPLFHFSDLKEELETILQKWFHRIRGLHGVHEVFFATVRDTKMYIESRLVHLSQTLEAYHRKTVPNEKHLPKKRWATVRKRITRSLPKRLPKALREAVEASIHHANDYSFFDRLEGLFASLEPETKSMITDDVTEFLRHIRGTRNLLTHLERNRKSKVFPEDRWPEVFDLMKAVIFILMLKRCGIAEDRIRRCGFGIEPYRFKESADDAPKTTHPF